MNKATETDYNVWLQAQLSKIRESHPTYPNSHTTSLDDAVLILTDFEDKVKQLLYKISNDVLFNTSDPVVTLSILDREFNFFMGIRSQTMSEWHNPDFKFADSVEVINYCQRIDSLLGSVKILLDYYNNLFGVQLDVSQK